MPIPVIPPSRRPVSAPVAVLLATCASLTLPAVAQSPATAQSPTTPAAHRPFADVAAALPWRELGPANMGGRVTDIAVPEQLTSTWYVATAGGGLWKTTNSGTTWTVTFDDQASVSIGDVAVAPSNPDVVWVGTGEENARNSVSWGDGVYKSTDGGETFAHMGLEETFQIGHIEIHPHDADIVFVAALGRLWGHNPDRGLFRSRDGGASWEKVLYVDERTGCIDVRIDPLEPSVVHALMYERMRDGFDTNDPSVRFGAKAGYYRSTDGGSTWSRIDAGLPTVAWGRSGLTVHHADPRVLYMTVETERSGWANGDERDAEPETPRGNAYMGIQGEDSKEPAGALLTTVTPEGPAQTAGIQAGDLVVRVGDDAIGDYEALTALIRRSQGGEQVEVEVLRGTERKTLQLTWGTRGPRGGRAPSPNGPFATRLGGQVANRQDRQEPNGFQTGGVFRSDDRGETWTRVNSLTDRPFYYSVIAVDPREPDFVYSCGVPFYASFDGGKEFDEVQRQIHVDFHAIWIDPNDSDHLLVGCDGGVYETFDRTATWRQVDNLTIGQVYHAQADQADPYRVHFGLQDNGTWSGPSRTRWREGIGVDDFVTTMGGDGFRAVVDPLDPDFYFATSQNGGVGGVDLANARTTRVSKPEDAGPFNWDTPFFVSPHNSRMLYFAGRRAALSLDRGEHSRSISPELGLTERGTATAFAESPRVAGLLYVGTDDGALWRSKDGGANWEPIHDHVIGLAGPRYVSCIEASAHADGRVFVTFEGHRSDDRSTYVFSSDDHGDTWRPLAAGLPARQPCHVIREDPRNEDLLFVGTEFACFASIDRGTSWCELAAGLPTVAVRDLFVHDRDGDLIAATHGRSIWILDIAPLRELEREPGEATALLFRPELATQWRMRSRVVLGHDRWFASNPPTGAVIHLWLAEPPPAGAAVTVHDVSGTLLASLPLAEQAGLQRLEWSLRATPPDGEGRGRRRGAGPPVAPGTYALRYRNGETTLAVPLAVRADPDGSSTPLSGPFSIDLSTTSGSRN